MVYVNLEDAAVASAKMARSMSRRSLSKAI